MDEPLSREQLIQRELMEGDTSNADIYPCDCGGCYKCNPCDPDYGNDRANEEEWDNDAEHAKEMEDLDEWADEPEPNDVPF